MLKRLNGHNPTDRVRGGSRGYSIRHGEAAPLYPDERIHALDILRGLALFGMISVHFHQRTRIEVTGLEDLIGWGRQSSRSTFVGSQPSPASG